MAKKIPAKKDLKPYPKLFSRFTHSKFIDQLSDALEKTLARPTGLLAGGLVFLLTSVVVLIICRYYGYEYNYFIGLVSFPLGFIAGILIELIFKLFKRR